MIDGSTQPGYAGKPLIEISGASAGAGAVGLDVSASNTTLNALAINSFAKAGIVVESNASNAIIQNNYLGTDPTGTLARGNGDGITVNGGSATVSRNVISANQGNGVTDSRGSVSITANLIGTDATGAKALGNRGDAVHLVSASAVTISGNTLSGSGGNGVSLDATTSSAITGNFIGTNSAGSSSTDASNNSLGNQGAGVFIITSSNNNTIGGTTAAARNIISGNAGNGVQISTTGSQSNLIQSNYIGTDVNGAIALPNQGNGIRFSTPGATISSNLISGNFGDGIAAAGNPTTITSNLIGTTAGGQQGLENKGDGVFITGNSNTVSGNTIAFNGITGVSVLSGTANAITQNSIFSNTDIGIDLGYNGVTQNDSAGHVGPNNYQNFPVLTTRFRTPPPARPSREH